VPRTPMCAKCSARGPDSRVPRCCPAVSPARPRCSSSSSVASWSPWPWPPPECAVRFPASLSPGRGPSGTATPRRPAPTCRRWRGVPPRRPSSPDRCSCRCPGGATCRPWPASPAGPRCDAPTAADRSRWPAAAPSRPAAGAVAGCPASSAGTAGAASCARPSWARGARRRSSAAHFPGCPCTPPERGRSSTGSPARPPSWSPRRARSRWQRVATRRPCCSTPGPRSTGPPSTPARRPCGAGSPPPRSLAGRGPAAGWSCAGRPPTRRCRRWRPWFVGTPPGSSSGSWPSDVGSRCPPRSPWRR